MKRNGRLQSSYGLENHGIINTGNQYWNLNTPSLYEEIIHRHEGHVSHLGPICVRTGHHTGRAAKDKFIVEEPSSTKLVWWGKVNKPFPEANFDRMFYRLLAYIQGKDLFIQDCAAGYDPKYRLPIRVVNESAWHNLFARNMFIQLSPDELRIHKPKFTILHVPNFHAVPELDGTNSEAFVLLHLGKRMVLIGGTGYGGEIKKSIFTVLNYLLPQDRVLSMHCSANIGRALDVALFFGLSGTGKTTLSSVPDRKLIGDDEHGWSDDGVFNFEGGCYAKVIRLSKESEPEIYETTRRFGTILENVGYDSITRRLDLDDGSLTDNTRAAYPLAHIPNALRESKGGHPKNIIMLTADAFGVMPPVAKLTPEQAMYHFVSGYTSKLAGTETGVGSEPQATFSACFGAPFMVLHPFTYAELLSKKIQEHKADCWLLNTGWSGGPYGVGKRMEINVTRALVNAILQGEFTGVEMRPDPLFGFMVPTSAPEVPSQLLSPRDTWKDQQAYDTKAKELIGQFVENFKQFENRASDIVKKGGPRSE